MRFFQERGHRVLGVDPAEKIAAEATARGIPTLARFFDAGLAAEIASEHGPAAVIIANNVIANIEDVGTFTGGLGALLAADGVFVFETQYGADVFARTLLDTVYTEHLSHCMLTPLAKHFARHGYEVIDVERIPTKGGSIRVSVQREGGRRTVSAAVGDLAADETRRGMAEPAYFRPFAERVRDIGGRLNAIVDEDEARGRFVAGYGASVGTSTLLHQFRLAERIRCLFDDNPDKESHLRGPGYAIPVLPAASVSEQNPGAIIIFAWRYAGSAIGPHELAQGGREHSRRHQVLAVVQFALFLRLLEGVRQHEPARRFDLVIAFGLARLVGRLDLEVGEHFRKLHLELVKRKGDPEIPFLIRAATKESQYHRIHPCTRFRQTANPPAAVQGRE